MNATVGWSLMLFEATMMLFAVVMVPVRIGAGDALEPRLGEDAPWRSLPSARPPP